MYWPLRQLELLPVLSTGAPSAAADTATSQVGRPVQRDATAEAAVNELQVPGPEDG